ncbi:hypothetical protein BSKO_01419 [Bryopsis sp. KO-2023]|nr:hypothetical protein BSKO_01419 [Bryopsis sp. KO-2023]
MEPPTCATASVLDHAPQRHTPRLSAPAKEFIAGGVSGMAGVLASQPLDTVRIRLQQKGNDYSGIFGALKSISSSEGPKSVFKGMGYPLGSATLQAAVTFWSFGTAMRFFHGDEYNFRDAHESYSSILMSGAFAGFAQSFVIAPVDVLKIRLQVQKAVPGDASYQGPIKMLANVIKNEGPRGLFRGLTVTILRDIPAYGAYFYTYHRMKDYLDPVDARPDAQKESRSAMLVGGAVAGMAAWCSYPFDVIKSRMQVHDRSNSPYRNWLDCGVKTVRGEGVRILFRGLNASVWHGIVSSGVIFLTYEMSMELLEKSSEEDGG